MFPQELRPPLDGSGHARRACPSCHAPFGVRWGPRDARALASALAARVQHLNAAESEAGALPRHCPYCGAKATPELFWPAAQRRWLDAAARELLAEVWWRTLRLPFERLGANPRPTYLAMKPRPRVVPADPEEGEDLERVPLPCCGEEVRLVRAWIGPVRCHFCGFVHARSATRDIGLELAALRDWTATP